MVENVEKKIEDFLEKHNLLNACNTLLVAFSGGVDSLCLLDIVYNLSKEYKFKFIVAHL